MAYDPGAKAVAEAQRWLRALEEAVAECQDVAAWVTVPLLLAIVDRETRCGLACRPPGPGGKGDGGHGHGLFQIDDRSHAVFLATGGWRDPKRAAVYAIRGVLAPALAYLMQRARDIPRDGEQLKWDAVAAYNCGAGNVAKALARHRGRDAYTTGGDYAKDVGKRMREFWEDWYAREQAARIEPKEVEDETN